MPEKSYDKMTEDRLVATLKELIAEETQGVATYEKVWQAVFKSGMHSHKIGIVLDALNQIIAEEEIHIDMLQSVLKTLQKY